MRGFVHVIAASIFLLLPQTLWAQPDQKWVVSWAASAHGPYPVGNPSAQPDQKFAFPSPPAGANDQTFRLIVRPDIWGRQARLRFTNAFGTKPITFDDVFVGLQMGGPGLVKGTNRPVTFGGHQSVRVTPGSTVWSDPVDLAFVRDPGAAELAGRKLAVSFHVAGESGPMTWHAKALTTSYVTAPGAGSKGKDEDEAAFPYSTASWFFVDALEMMAPADSFAIVAFGDSITDGTCTTVNAHERWEDVLAQRLALRQSADRAVINEGIGGNTVTGGANLQPAPTSPPGVERLDRDVLSHAGVSHVVLFMGTNDIRREAPADQVIAGTKDIIARVKARGMKIIGATIVPRHSVVPGVGNTGWNDAKTKVRNQVNDWIRKGTDFDAVIDFDKVVRSASDPDLLNPAYNCGDGVHPSSIGYYQMGKSVDLGLFG